MVQEHERKQRNQQAREKSQNGTARNEQYHFIDDSLDLM
jgi:hypothetical protein